MPLDATEPEVVPRGELERGWSKSGIPSPDEVLSGAVATGFTLAGDEGDRVALGSLVTGV